MHHAPTRRRPTRTGRRTALMAVAGLAALTATGTAAGAATSHPEATRSAPTPTARPVTPAASGWRFAGPYTVPGLTAAVNALSCPSVDLCMAISGGDVFHSTNPSKASSWHHVTLDHAFGVILSGLSCPTTSFCLAVDENGDSFSTTHPTGGAGSWRPAGISSNELTRLDCSSPRLCAATDVDGNALTSTDAGGSRPAWSVRTVDGPLNAYGYDVSCSSPRLCAVVEGTDTVAISTDPSSPSPTWRLTRTSTDTLGSIACAASTLCVASQEGGGHLVVSHDPTGGRSAWRAVDFGSSANLDRVTCRTEALCVVSGGPGVYVSDRPEPSASAWHGVAAPGLGSETAVACPSTSVCLVGSSINQIDVMRRS